MAVIETFRLFSEISSSITCKASSRVGTRISAWGSSPLRAVIRSRTGRPKAAVLPVPVWAWAMMSLSSWAKK